jgi:hypothetical protein
VGTFVFIGCVNSTRQAAPGTVRAPTCYKLTLEEQRILLQYRAKYASRQKLVHTFAKKKKSDGNSAE